MSNTEKFAVTLLPGDGIGPEVVFAAQRIIDASGAPIRWDVQEIGVRALEKHGTMLPDQTLRSIEENCVALKGPTGTPPGGGHKSLNVTLRQHFDLYANVRPIVTVHGVNTRYSDLDLNILLFRENVEGEYNITEERIEGGVKTSFIFTDAGCERIARFAFKTARRSGRKRMVIVHKANIIKMAHGLFLEKCREVAKEYDDIETWDLIADNTFQQMVMRPQQFDCVVTTNLLGDLLSDGFAGTVGGVGFAPGGNIGDKVAIYEAVHGTADQGKGNIVGLDCANLGSVTLSGVMMLDYLGLKTHADHVSQALLATYGEGGWVNGYGGLTSLSKFTEAVIGRLQ